MCCIFSLAGCVVMYGCFGGMHLILVLFLGCWNESVDNSYMIVSDFYWWMFPCPVYFFFSLEEMRGNLA